MPGRDLDQTGGEAVGAGPAPAGAWCRQSGRHGLSLGRQGRSGRTGCQRIPRRHSASGLVLGGQCVASEVVQKVVV